MRFTRALIVLAIVAALAGAADAAPIRLARHPDYHAGKVTFSYLGDIWVASEDGTNVQRLTDNRASEIYPRFSPDGKWIAFSSNRYGNDEVVGWTRDSQRVLFRAAHGDGAFPNVATLYEVPVGGGQEQPLPVDWGFAGTFSPAR